MRPIPSLLPPFLVGAGVAADRRDHRASVRVKINHVVRVIIVVVVAWAIAQRTVGCAIPGPECRPPGAAGSRYRTADQQQVQQFPGLFVANGEAPE